MLDAPRRIEHEALTGRVNALLRVSKPSLTWRQTLRPAAERLWSWRYRTLTAAVLLLGGWYFGTPLLLGPIVNVDPVVRADFVVSVVASGHVEASFRVNIGSQITGIVAEVPVAEGQSVKAGDVLIVLDNREARSAAVEA